MCMAPPSHNCLLVGETPFLFSKDSSPTLRERCAKARPIASAMIGLSYVWSAGELLEFRGSQKRFALRPDYVDKTGIEHQHPLKITPALAHHLAIEPILLHFPCVCYPPCRKNQLTTYTWKYLSHIGKRSGLGLRAELRSFCHWTLYKNSHHVGWRCHSWLHCTTGASPPDAVLWPHGITDSLGDVALLVPSARKMQLPLSLLLKEWSSGWHGMKALQSQRMTYLKWFPLKSSCISHSGSNLANCLIILFKCLCCCKHQFIRPPFSGWKSLCFCKYPCPFLSFVILPEQHHDDINSIPSKGYWTNLGVSLYSRAQALQSMSLKQHPLLGKI